MTNLVSNLTGLRTNYKTKPLAQLWRILTWTTLIEIGSSRWWHLLLLFQIWESYKGETFDIYLFAPHWQIHYPAAPIVPAAVILQWHENQASLALHWRLSSGSPEFLQAFIYTGTAEALSLSVSSYCVSLSSVNIFHCWTIQTRLCLLVSEEKSKIT